MKTAVIILGHGSRNKGAGDAVQKAAAEVKRLGGYDIVDYAFLQYSTPTLSTVLKKCVRQRTGHIVIVPFFTQSGSHVTRGIPELVERAREQYPDVEIVVTSYVGAHPLMAKIVEDLVKKRD